MNKASKTLKIILGILCATIVLVFWYFIRQPGTPTAYMNSDGNKVHALEFTNGIYEGDSVFGLPSGNGSFSFKTGETYSGNWDGADMSGSGTLQYSDGVYEGNFVASNRNGEGSFTWTDGTIYTGEWLNDQIDGYGELTTPNGVSFAGTFHENELVDGSLFGKTQKYSYTIDIENAKLKDIVSINFVSGSRYEGEYANGTLNGTGTMTYPDGSSYHGNFLNGKRFGEGTYTWKNGHYCTGTWENDLLDGDAIYHFSSNEKLACKYSGGKFVDGVYKFTNSNGSFITTWENGACTNVERK